VVSTDAGLVRLRIASVGDRPHAGWAEGLDVHIPSPLISSPEWRGAVSTDGALRIPSGRSPVSESDVVRVREYRAFTDVPPASARLPVSYQVVPGRLRAVIGSLIGRWNRGRADRWGAFPRWPIDLSADFLADLIDGQPSRTAGARSGPAPVIVTHDIDSPEGLSNLLSEFLPLEEAAGARSTNYVVPCAWPVDTVLVNEMTSRGHEVGVHGYDHSNRTPFAAAGDRAKRLDAARLFGGRHGATGYRAPSLLRTRALLRDLAPRFRYDSSIPTAGGLFPTPNNGCASARPFSIETITELPVSLPRDGMLRFLGYAPDDIFRLWTECAELIARAGGVVVLLTHCERRFSGNPPLLGAYRRFLDYINERPERFAFSTPARVLFESV
jgi:peptidoglycan/xylan/chitin deacetylase (PgdA/CDA1 family)